MGDIGKIPTIELRDQLVRAELNRVLESQAFRTSKRCSEFLGYVVDQTLNGPSGNLKERLIGVELFQLPPDFDTGQHTIVRVTANEVRKRLAQHYVSENGSPHIVTIHLPPGSYSAEFRWGSPKDREHAAESDEMPAALESSEELPSRKGPVIVGAQPSNAARLGWMSRSVVAAATVVLISAAGYAVWHWSGGKPVSGASPALTVSAAPALPGKGDLRMIMGLKDPYLDRSSRSWLPDQFFTGGSIIVRPSERVLRTLDPDMYRHSRVGEFQYNIPLDKGAYEMHLHFAETGLSDFISAESSGEGQRLFRISANDKRIVDALDVVADAAGANISDERVFRDISPAEDGVLHLSLSAIRGSPMLSAIELLPVKPGSVRPVRIRSGWTSSWQDSAGQQWGADSYFMGGNALVRAKNPAQQETSIAPDIALYGSERWGHFSYAIPVAEGRYKVKLKFVEGHYGPRNTGVGGVGSRLFDVYCNGVALLRKFDILKEAGGEGHPIDKIFTGVEPNAQGKIILTFVPIKGMACVNGIEVLEDAR